MNYHKRGFTLVEILTVVAIIMIIGGFSLAAISNARTRSRDDQRIRDIKLIQTSLELYRTDIDRSTDLAADANRYAYPVKTATTGFGIYGDVRFAKYLTKTPIDPLRKLNYAYFAPACLRPAYESSPAIVSPANGATFRTGSEIRAQSSLAANDPARYCPQGSGWLPYVVYGVLEQPISGKSKTSTLTSLAKSTRAVAYSIVEPIYVSVAEAEPISSYSFVPGLSLCYPATTDCTDPFNPTPATTPSPLLATSPISSPITSPVMTSPSPSASPSPMMSPL